MLKSPSSPSPGVVARSPFLILSILVLATLAAAGCLSAPSGVSTSSVGGDVAGAEWAKKAMPFGNGHDHRKWDEHVGLSTPNFQELAYDPLATQYYENKTAVGYFCGGEGATKDGRKLTVISSYDSDVAFVLVDVTDPMHPVKVGEYVIKGTTHYDVDITPDAKYVVIGSDPSARSVGGPFANAAGAASSVTDLAPPIGTFTAQPMWRDACTGEERAAGPEQQLPLAPATLLVDITDPKNPTLADVAPAPILGPHSVSTASINNVTYVASSITNLAHHASYFEFFQIVETPAGARLALQSVVDSGMYGKNVLDPAGGPRSEVSNGHVDAEIAMHPATHKPVVYLSDWNGGMIILDFSDPMAPTMLSSWQDTGPDAGAVHSTRSIGELWDGRHYVLVGQEFTHRPVNRPSGWLYVIDDTDPAHPKEVGRWTLPVDSEAHWNGKGDGLETYSTHYFRVVGRTVFMAMYHAGIWAIDLSTPEKMAAPPSVGVFVPDKAPPSPRRAPTGGYDLTPFVLDVFPNPDYTMTVFDGYSGVYSVKYDPAHPMPSPTPWPASGKAHEDG